MSCKPPENLRSLLLGKGVCRNNRSARLGQEAKTGGHIGKFQPKCAKPRGRMLRCLAGAGIVVGQMCLTAVAAPRGDTPVTPNASPEAQSLLAYCWDIYGKKILSGQQDGASDESQPESEFIHIEQTTGNLPAIHAFDLNPYTPPPLSAEQKSHLAVTQRAIDWYVKKNGIVSLCWHWHAPIGKKAIYSKDTAFDLQRAVTEGTPEHAAILRDLDAIAEQLKTLRDAHVPVLWRPLHEANGRWFWWGAQGNPEPFKKLWRLMFDRFVNYHKLNNLIWVFSLGSATDLTEWYPGDEYVDIIGGDYYPMDGNNSPAKGIFDQLVALGHGKKLVALSENACDSRSRPSRERKGWLAVFRNLVGFHTVPAQLQ